MRVFLARAVRAPVSAAVHILVGLMAVLLLWAATGPQGIRPAAFLLTLACLGVLDLLGCTALVGALRLLGRWFR